MASIKLYQFPAIADQPSASPFCTKVQYALKYKRLPFEIITVGNPVQVSRLNPQRKIPVLDYDGKLIPDSSEIVAALEARHPEPRLYPQDEKLLGRALLIEDWADESLYWHVIYERWLIDEQWNQVSPILFGAVPSAMRALVKVVARRGVRSGMRGQGLGRLTIEGHREKLGQATKWLENQLDGKFLCGDEMSVADIAVTAQLAALCIPYTPHSAAIIAKQPKLVSWIDRVKQAAS